MKEHYEEVLDQLRIFGMENIFMENALDELEEEGIVIGRALNKKHEDPVDTDMFERDILQNARKMADFYVIYFVLENSARRIITQVLSEKYGKDWWMNAVPQKVRDEVERKKKEELESAMSIRSDDPLSYINFGELIDIFNFKWDDFSDLFRSRRSLQETLSQFNRIRNVIAHSCTLNDDEIQRFRILINDWFRIQS
jgi:hypothetical protein